MNDVKKYFENENFKNLLEALKNKYLIYGKCVGTISIYLKTTEEAEKISLFLSTNLKSNQTYKIKISNIQKSLDESRFEGITVEDLIFLFYPSIKTNKQKRTEIEDQFQKELKNYQIKYKNTILESLFNEEYVSKIRTLLLNEKGLLDIICNACINLPINKNEYQELSIFSMNITGNPHFFDFDTHASNLLIQFICYLFSYEFPNSRKEKIKILENVGILIDSVSNFVITYNLEGNEMVNSFQKQLTPLTLNLSNLNKIDKIKAKNNKVLIIENPSFLSKVINQKIPYSVIITSGNPNIAVYKLLEKLENCEIYFNGDYDPEGLLIAQNLKKRFPFLNLIGYTKEYYLNSLSKNKLSDSRLKKLNSIEEKELLLIKTLLLEYRCSSYQEGIYDEILKEINN